MKTLKKGSKGKMVEKLQTLLNAAGYECGKADGMFGNKTLVAVKSFQKDKGLTVDGIVGAKTWSVLQATSGRFEPKSAHFKMSEFKCKDGTAVPSIYWNNLEKLMNMLEEIRSAVGNKAISIHSGYRTVSHNKKCGGAPKSQHLTASAADIKVSGIKPSDVYAICDRLVGSRGGVGKYSTFTHVDIRGKRARW